MPAHPQVLPNGLVRSFGDDETIVSKTDVKGRITYSNDVFARVCGYTEEELLGQPQNLIRHPDMPAGVFKLLWQRLEAGHESFSYIINLARDGVAYWVFAHISPTRDRSGKIVGYHSMRRTAPDAAIAVVTPVYRKIRAIERAAGSGPKAAEAGLAEVQAFLAAEQRDYDEWVWSVVDATASRARRAA